MEPAESEQYAALERFDQDPELAELERLLSEFNLFRLLGLGGSEETHSRVLAWLLNPRENHRLGEAFLNRFMAATMPLDGAGADWSAAQVQREWQNAVDGQGGRLDLLILDEGQQFLCAIENKVRSGEHSDQLTRYRRALENRYPDFTRRYLFLSPWGTLAQDAAERKHWQAVDYGIIRQLVAETAQDFADASSAAALAFLRQYADVLRRDILGDMDLRRLAATVYQQHKGAVDFINSTVPGYHRQEVGRILKEAVDRLQWDFACEDSGQIRFLPDDWKRFQAIGLGTGWKGAGSDALILFEFKYYQTLSLVITISPIQPEHEATRQTIDSCLTGVTFPAFRRWTWGEYILFNIGDTILEKSDFEQWDETAIRSKLADGVSAFAQNQYPQIRDAVTRCLEEFEASGQP